MRTRLRDGLIQAMKARDAVAVSALRSAIAAIDNAEAVAISEEPEGEDSSSAMSGSATHPTFAGSVVGLGAGEVPRKALSDGEIQAIVEAEVTSRRAAAEEYRQMGRADRADRLGREADVITDVAW